MIARRVFLSKLLEPKEAERAQSVLMEIDKDVVFAESLDEAPVLRISTRAEISYETATAPFSITPLCLFQMRDMKIDPFQFEWNCNLIHLFLFGKSVSIVFFNASAKKRLGTLIEQMGGSVHEDEKVDFLVASSPIEVQGDAIVVQACWIEKLFGANTFQSYTKFTFRKSEPPVYPASQIPKQRTPAPFSQLPKKVKPKRPPSSPRLTLKVTSPAQRNLCDFGIGVQEIPKPKGDIKRSLSMRSQIKAKVRVAPGRSNSKVDEFFPKSSQSSQSSQLSQLSPGSVQASDSYEDSEMSMKLSGELLLEKETKQEPRKPKKTLREGIEDFLKKVKKAGHKKEVVQVSDDDDNPPPPPKPTLQRVAGEPESLDIVLSSSESEDEGLKSAIMGVKSPMSKKLNDLATRVLTSKPNQSRFIVEPPSDDKDAMISQWVSFSQKDEDCDVTFDIDYDRDVLQRDFVASTGQDPLFDLFAQKKS